MLKRLRSVFLISSSIILVVLLCMSCSEPAATTTSATGATTEPTASPTIKTKILRFAVPLPANDPMVESEMQIAEEFNAAAEGRYKIEMYPGGVLGSMSEAFELTMAGAIDICDMGMSSASSKDSRFSAQSLPFQVKDFNASQKFYDLIRDAIWQDVLREDFNVELMSLSSGNAYQYLGNEPIYTMEDWKGKVIWVANSTEAEIVKALGGSGTVLDWSDGPSAMEKGVVDGALRPGVAAAMFKWEMLSYATRCNFTFSSIAIAMNADVFNSMPSDLQEVLVEAFKRHEQRQIEYWGNMEVSPYEDLAADGWEIYDLPADERAKWMDATQPIIDEYYSHLDPSDAEIIKGIFIEANK